ncbi:hypothetical protein CHUAL_000781 [Chamberlinius hualienensis]
METYLYSTKANLARLHKGDRLHIVLGNEACDMDSVASSLIYAYFIYKTNLRPDTVVVPVLNIHQRDFQLRPDIGRFLEEINISTELLTFRNNLDLKALSSGHRITLTLVDHNILSKEDRELHDFVDEVIDHHNKEVDYNQSKCQVTIEPVGSTCTLIAEKILRVKPELLDSKMALLLYGTILLDTCCLNPEAQRVTPKDKGMIEKLEPILEGVKRLELFDKLQRWRNDVSGMSMTDLLRKDVKIISNDTIRIAVASVPTLLEELFKNDRAEQGLKSFVSEMSSQVLVVMGIWIDSCSEPVRQIAIYSEHLNYREQLSEVLENASTRGPSLALIPLPSTLPNVIIYNQGNTSASRKVVLPLLNTFLGARTFVFNIGGCAVTPPNNCDDSNNPAIYRRPTPEGRNEDDEVESFDPLAAESEDVVVESVGTALGHLHVLGIGDPISHAGSSQSSSNQNSCPYTPQNSCNDGGLEHDPYARQILPSFNSREMMEKIESKRGKLRGYVGDGDNDNATAYPFTPKNSFVDGSFENYIRGASSNSFDTGDFMVQIHDRMARVSAKRTEPDGAGCTIADVRKPQNGSLELHGRKENESKSPDRYLEGKDDETW